MKIITNLKKGYRQIFPDYLTELKEVIGDTKTLLDVGCGSNSPVQFLSPKIKTTGIDAFEPSLNESKARKIHQEYVLDNVLSINNHFTPHSFETVVALDLIEHLKKGEAESLINKMESIATTKVVIFTPNGFLPQGEFANNTHQVHLSGWSVNDLRIRGYRVVGVNGLKCLRGEFAAIKFWPRMIWLVISDLTQLITRSYPQLAFQLLAIKDISSVR